MVASHARTPSWCRNQLLTCAKPLNCCLWQGPFVDCNVRIHNLQRIEHSVGTALRKWAMQHDQQLPPIQRQS